MTLKQHKAAVDSYIKAVSYITRETREAIEKNYAYANIPTKILKTYMEGSKGYYEQYRQK